MAEHEGAKAFSSTAPGLPSQVFSVKPPEPVKLDKNASANWKLWKQLWSHYCIVSTGGAQSPQFLKSLLISTMGMEALQIYNGCDPTDTDTAEDIIKKLDDHILGESSETFERYKFNTRIQKPDESIDDYLASLKTLAGSCNFCDCLKDTLLRDRLVLGAKDEQARKRLLQEGKLTLQRAVDICRSYEKTTNQLKIISGREEEDVHHLTAGHSTRRSSNKRHNSTRPSQPKDRESGVKSRNCKFCGQAHKLKRELCPAWGKRCNKCHESNHFARCCMSKAKNLHAVKEEGSSDVETDSSEDVFSVDTHDMSQSGAVYAELSLEDGKKVKFQIDSGATVNVLPAKCVNKALEESHTVLKMYNRSSLKPIGRCKLSVANPVNGKKHKIQFEVVAENLTPILSRHDAERMNLITINYDNFKQVHQVSTGPELSPEYNSVFDDSTVGCFQGKVHLAIDKDAKPVQCSPRRVPVALRSRVEKELNNLVNLGVITPVTQPTEWCSQMSVQTKKNGKLRICIDPQTLNDALRRERYPLPTMEDLLPELSDAKLFSKVDLANGYWHCELDDDSSYLTTFITPFGRYRWLRLPFGLKVSSEIFQRKLNETLTGLNGAASVADDILVYGTSEEDHDNKLNELFKVCSKNNVKLNREKGVFRTTQVEFLGHLVTNQGLKPDPKKIAAIQIMESPVDVEGVRRLLGMVTYLSKFLPQLSTVAEPIRRLTRQDVEWAWNAEQEESFKRIKTLVTEAPVLAYYDPAKELVVQCDASSKGLGAVLLQEGKPLEYASRALSDTESGYAQIEKECLAIVFALERFHQYTFGRCTIVHSDHKPLEMIVRKPLHKAPKRLQGMLLRLMQYDIEVIYKKGKEMLIADTLSRAYIPGETENSDSFARINSVRHLRIRDERLKEFKEATAADETMQILKSVILKGWPESKEDLPVQVTPYFSFRDELSLADGLIFKGERVVVPKSMRKTLKNQLHISHLGGNSMIRRARECVYWPGMSAEIEQVASSCDVCQSLPKTQQKETLMPIESTFPWEIVGVDLFTLDNKDYLLTIDYFSGFWEIDQLKSTTSLTVINRLKNHFSRYGIPCKVISDNGPQFSSEEFSVFAVSWGFDHTPSSPHHPNANGKAESGVKAAKTMLKKCAQSNTDPRLALLEIRNTPTQGTNTSPAQRLMNRKTRSVIPITKQQLEPRGKEFLQQDTFKQRQQQKKQSLAYNKSAKDLPPLEEGDTVRLQPFKTGRKEWERGTILKRLDERSYEVDTQSGTCRRNRAHLRKTVEVTQPDRQKTFQGAEPPQTFHKGPGTEEDQQPSLNPAPDEPHPTESAPKIPSPQKQLVLRRSTREIKQPSYLKDYKL